MLRVVEMEQTSIRLRISIIDSTDACIDGSREAMGASLERECDVHSSAHTERVVPHVSGLSLLAGEHRMFDHAFAREFVLSSLTTSACFGRWPL
jgi:hypothetical protein